MKNQKTFELVLTALFAAIIMFMAFTSLGYIPLVVINATIVHIPVILGAVFLGPKKGAFLGFIFGLTSFINNTFKAATASAFVFSPVIASSMIGPSGIWKSLYICFVPRILVGVVPYFVFVLVRQLLLKGGKTSRLVINLLASVILIISLRAFLLNLMKDSMSATVALAIAVVAGCVLFGVLTYSAKNQSTLGIAFAYAGLTGAFTNTLLVMSGIYILYKDAYAQAIGVAGDAVINVIMGVVTFNGVVEATVAAIIVAALGVVLFKFKPIEHK